MIEELFESIPGIKESNWTYETYMQSMYIALI